MADPKLRKLEKAVDVLEAERQIMMQKLRYVACALTDVEPIVKTGEVDITPEDIGVTVEQFYQQAAQERQARIDIALDAHPPQIFSPESERT